MFGAIFLTILLLIGAAFAWIGFFLAMGLWAQSRTTGCIPALLILAGGIAYLALWVYGVTVVIHWWIEIL